MMDAFSSLSIALAYEARDHMGLEKLPDKVMRSEV